MRIQRFPAEFKEEAVLSGMYAAGIKGAR